MVDVNEVSYPKNLTSHQPLLEGMYVYSRVGVLLSKYGLGCGWDGHEVPLLRQAIFYDVGSANKIGLNIAGYAVGYARLGRAEAKPELYGALDENHPTDEFVFAQIKHDGAWNVHSGRRHAVARGTAPRHLAAGEPQARAGPARARRIWLRLPSFTCPAWMTFTWMPRRLPP